VANLESALDGTTEAHAMRTVSVLVIDDDDEARDMLSAVLNHAGYTVVTAADGVEALQLLATIRPELILLDVQMPRCDGAQFRQQQRRHRDWIRIPTVVMTGVEAEPVLDVGVELALRKPIRRREVLALAERYCSARQHD
jgi:two-component system response regulator MprA